MPYNPPSFQLTQQLVAPASANAVPLYACVIGANYGLHRFSVASEIAALAAYDPVNGNTSAVWPNKNVNSVVDLPSAAVYIQNAILEYLGLSISAGAGTGILVSGGNTVRTAGEVLASNSFATRDSALGNRDVQAGDYISVTSGGTTISTKVLGLIADTVAATTGSSTPAASNQATIGAASAPISNKTIAAGDITVTASATNYNGLASGAVVEVYVVTAIDATHVSVVSQTSGTDNVASQAISAYGAATALGTRGATFTLAHSAAGTLQAGDTFTVTVSQQFTAVTPASSGTYSGKSSDTYVIKILQGGKLAASGTVVFAVSTVNGNDASWGSTTVPAAGGVFSIGNYGILATFAAGSQYRTGDQFTIAAGAAGVGAIRTAITAAPLTGLVAASACTIQFGLYESVELNSAFWSVAADSILVEAGATYTGSSELGVSTTFDILGGTVCMEYRELLLGAVNIINSIDGSTDVASILGPVDPLNPLALAVAADEPEYFSRSTEARADVHVAGGRSETDVAGE